MITFRLSPVPLNNSCGIIRKIPLGGSMKIFLILTTILTAAQAFALDYPTEGRYGSHTIYCGMEISHHPVTSDLIITHIHNPAFKNHYCTHNGRSIEYKAVPSKNYFMFNKNRETYCVLKEKNRSQFVQSCFYKNTNEIHSSLKYYLY